MCVPTNKTTAPALGLLTRAIVAETSSGAWVRETWMVGLVEERDLEPSKAWGFGSAIVLGG